MIAPLVVLVGWALISLHWSRAAVDPHSLHKYADIEKLTGMKLVLQLGLYGALAAAAQRISPRGAKLALTVLAVALTALGCPRFWRTRSRAGRPMPGSARGFGQVLRADIARRNIAQGDYVIVLFFWCAAVRAAELRWQILSIAMAACVAASSLFLHAVDATLAALALSFAAFFLVRVTRVFGVLLLGVGSTIYWMTAPLVVLAGVHGGLVAALRPHVQKSWDERLDIWSLRRRQGGRQALDRLGPGRQPHLRPRPSRCIPTTPPSSSGWNWAWSGR